MDSRGAKSTDLREASFSYLTQQGENLVLALTDQTSPVQFTQPAPGMISSASERSRSATKDEEAGEISVFGAERYFNMKLDDDDDSRPRNIVDNNINSGKHVHEKLEYPVDLQRTTRPKSRLGTPSVNSSEAISWNSQTALLPNSSHNSRPDQKVNEKWFFTGFACNGSCSDKKSVYIDKNIIGHRSGVHGKGKDHHPRKESARGNHPVLLDQETRKQSHNDQSRVIHDQVIKKYDDHDQFRFQRTIGGSKREEEYFVLPCVNSGVLQNLNVKRGEPKIVEDDPRKSLEVFGSHMLKREDIALNLERKLSVLTWDAIPKAPNLPTTNSNSNSSQMFEDIESEGSSDLFEIENLSGSSHVQPIFAELLQTSDGLSSSSCMTVPPTSRYVYEPSESSIEWSVVTASAAAAADFSAVSVLDDYDQKVLGTENNTTISSPGGPGFITPTVPKRSRPNGLLGCKNQKAVDVAEAAYKRNDKAKSSSHLQQLRRTQFPIPILRKLQPDHEHIYGERF